MKIYFDHEKLDGYQQACAGILREDEAGYAEHEHEKE
jgi:hypothetical protein